MPRSSKTRSSLPSKHTFSRTYHHTGQLIYSDLTRFSPSFVSGESAVLYCSTESSAKWASKPRYMRGLTSRPTSAAAAAAATISIAKAAAGSSLAAALLLAFFLTYIPSLVMVKISNLNNFASWNWFFSSSLAFFGDIETRGS